MTESKQRIEAALKAESDLWQHYDLSVKEQFIDIPAPPLQVRMLEMGNSAGVPLVFVQGGLGEAIGWYSLITHLADDFRCITLDRPGGGLSDGIDFLEVDVRKLAVDVLQAVLDAAHLDQAAFVANSMGAWWTIQLALHAPDIRCQKHQQPSAAHSQFVAACRESKFTIERSTKRHSCNHYHLQYSSTI